MSTRIQFNRSDLGSEVKLERLNAELRKRSGAAGPSLPVSVINEAARQLIDKANALAASGHLLHHEAMRRAGKVPSAKVLSTNP